MTKNDNVIRFYDDMAAYYYLIFEDWQTSSKRQGAIINRLIRERMGDGELDVLDCACGIGTQVIGLAQHPDYRLHATDISPQAVAWAKTEAEKNGLPITFGVADMRTLPAQVAEQFDVVMAFDNALPHLLTDDDLNAAVSALYQTIRAGGLLMASIRDYDALLADRPQAMAHRVFETEQGKRVTFQVWDWDDEHYAVTQFIVMPDNDTWTLKHFTTHYRALRRQTLTESLLNVGFVDVTWLMPDESGYYQPIVIAQKNSG